MILGLLLIIIIIALVFRKDKPQLHSHWNTMLDEFQYSTKEFYAQLEAELKANNINGISYREKNINTGGVLSQKRIYLRVTWKEYTYDCCCAPFGKGTFVSWWLFTERGGIEKIMAKIPVFGEKLVNTFFPITYYRSDTASMFMTLAQHSVNQVIENITKDKGVRFDNIKRPEMKNIFSR